jgi:simple sugar transport system permease protein
MAIAVVIGFVNGWFVTFLKIPSFLVTLGMLLVVRGSALYITDGFGDMERRGSSLPNIVVGEFAD